MTSLAPPAFAHALKLGGVTAVTSLSAPRSRRVLGSLPIHSCFEKRGGQGCSLFPPASESCSLHRAATRHLRTELYKARRRTGRLVTTMASSSSPSAEKKPITIVSVEQGTEIFQRMQSHQKSAAVLSPADNSRTIVESLGRAVLSTFSKKFAGFPFGSPVSYAADERGRPILSISTLSPHTADLEADPSCSMLISKDMKVMTETVITIIGRAYRVPEAEEKQVRDVFLKKHPDALWVDFQDFSFVRLEPEHVRCVSNVASSVGAGTSVITGEEYMAGTADFVTPFAQAIMGHMNADHEADTAAIVTHSLGIKFDNAKMVGVDRLGMQVQVKCFSEMLTLRIPFPRPATSRKDIKDIIVEMTQAAAAYMAS